MLSIEVTPLPGDNIEETAREMFRLSCALHASIHCEFNGVRLFVGPHKNSDFVIDWYWKEIERKEKAANQ